MMNGMIYASQISFQPASSDNSRNLRLFTDNLGWSAPASGYVKVQFGRKVKVVYIIFQNGGVLSASPSNPKFTISDGSSSSLKYQVIESFL